MNVSNDYLKYDRISSYSGHIFENSINYIQKLISLKRARTILFEVVYEVVKHKISSCNKQKIYEIKNKL